MQYLVADTDLSDAYLLQPYPYPGAGPAAGATGADQPSFTEEDLYTAIGEKFGFVETLPATVPDTPLTELHYQDPMPYGILLRAESGRVLCMAQDIRKDATTYQKMEGHILSAEWGQLLWLPPGFAHGCSAIGGPAKIICALTEPYDPRHVRPVPGVAEACRAWNAA